MRRCNPLPWACLLALLACAPEPPAVSDASPPVAYAANADLPAGWSLEAVATYDTLAGLIHTESGFEIGVDIGMWATSFGRPRNYASLEEGSNPDYYAWRRSNDPQTVTVLIRNPHPEGGAFSFKWRLADREASRLILRQLLDSHESIRQALLEPNR